MIIVSTTSEHEAEALAGLLSSSTVGLDYRVFLYGREFAASPRLRPAAPARSGPNVRAEGPS